MLGSQSKYGVCAFETSEEDAVARMADKKMRRSMSGSAGYARTSLAEPLRSVIGSVWRRRRQSKSFAREHFSALFSDSITLKDASVWTRRGFLSERARRVRVGSSGVERLNQNCN